MSVARALASYHCAQAFKECFRHKRSFSERERDFTVSIHVCLGYPPRDDPRALKALARVTGEFAKGLAAGRMVIEELDSLEEALMDYGFDLAAPITRCDPLPMYDPPEGKP